MNSRSPIFLLTLCTLFLFGCASTSMVPYTFAEKHLYDTRHFKDPNESCELGYQKVYYVVKNKTKAGGSALLTMVNCLTADHVEKLQELATAPDKYSSDLPSSEPSSTERQVAKIIEDFRTPLPKVSD